MKPSQFVCRNCGCTVHVWVKPKTGVTYWKHATGWKSKTKACKKAEPVKREHFSVRI